jgi:uncharacterized protein YyaL (SSP411 family)
VPSGNGVAARALGRLGHLLGEPRYLAAAGRVLRAAGALLEQAPSAHSGLLLALAEHHAPPAQVVVRTDATDVACPTDALGFVIPTGENDLPGALATMAARGAYTAFLCRGTACSAPLASPEALNAALETGA